MITIKTIKNIGELKRILFLMLKEWDERRKLGLIPDHRWIAVKEFQFNPTVSKECVIYTGQGHKGLSWGEKITITFRSQMEQGLFLNILDIESSMTEQTVSWGINTSNENIVANALRQRIGKPFLVK